MEKNKLIFLLLIFVVIVFISIYLIRFFSERQLDDISPEIYCKESLLEKADIYYVIPKYNNKSIADNLEWCERIGKMDKQLELHGVYHTDNEFLQDRSEKYLQEGINVFEKCFNQKPKRFKPPQLTISKNSKLLVTKRMTLDLKFNQFFHKVYHCDEKGLLPNWFVDLI